MKDIIFPAVLCFLGIGILLALIRAVRGPRIADRVMSVNIIGSLSSGSIAVLAVYLEESWLLDVCLIYSMMSFLAVAILAMVRISGASGTKEEIK